ncbi:MAG TPA: M24 family metallopeptidase [Planctomycetaceae bacterium]|nr:M24 family metallopeptidase [Planctomycetaceae bacterium]
MSVATNESTQPLSSGEFDFTDPDRYDDVERKQKRIAEFLARKQYDGVLLQKPANFAWFTCGAEAPRFGGDESAASLFITPDARVVVANNVDASQLFDKQLGGLGFQLKQRPWHEDRQVLFSDLCRGRNVASDTGVESTINESADIAALRLPLEPSECLRMRQLGAIVAHAVEATARHVEIGQSESEIAGQLAHRLVRHEVQPLWSRTIADGRGAAYRHWTAGDWTLRRWCTIAAVGSRWGLCCACARTVVLGSPPLDLVSAYQQAAMLTATGMFFSRAGSPFSTVWQKVRRIYEKVGHPDEWQLADQAELIGYHPRELRLLPSSDFTLKAGMPIHWHPSIGPVQFGDTLLVREEREEGGDLLTRAVEWPMLGITVRGHSVHLPDLLVREAGGATHGANGA